MYKTKHVFLLSIFLMLLSANKAGVIGKKENIIPANKIISCGPVENDENASIFILPNHVTNTRIRQNVFDLSRSQIKAIRRGLIRMKALNNLKNKKGAPYHTSMKFQAQLHTKFLQKQTNSDGKISEACIHKLGFFLAWHRMYLYFFEQILIAKSGKPDLALPYWDYSKNKKLPRTYTIERLTYKNKSYQNPLYDATRNKDMNAGGKLPGSIAQTIDKAMNETIYTDFEALILDLHAAIHSSTGTNQKSVGNMGNLRLSPNDPIFWLHHTNIDRLWEQWLTLGRGRLNPTGDDEWMNQSYTFYNAEGNAIRMFGYQIVNTAMNLNYFYDDIGQQQQSHRMPLPNEPADVKTEYLLTNQPSHVINNPLSIFSLKNISQLDENDPTVISPLSEDIHVCFRASGIEVNKFPAGIIEAYLVPEGSNYQETITSTSFIGLLNLFASNQSLNKGMPLPAIDMDITAAMQEQDISIAQLKNMAIVFRIRGNDAGGKEIKTSALVKLLNPSIAVNITSQPGSQFYQSVFKSI